MRFLTTALSQLKEFQLLAGAVAQNALPASVTGLSGIHKAGFIYSLCVLQKRRAFVGAADEAEAQRLCEDLSAMGMHPLIYPARDFSFRDTEGSSHEYEHLRLHVLACLQNGTCDCVIACMDAALQYTLPPEQLQNSTVLLKTAQTFPPQKAVQLLLACGYERAEQTEGKGQFSLRGGILDFFTPGAP